MQERQKWGNMRRYFTPGDVIIVVDPSLHHVALGSWEECGSQLDSKGLVRAVKIKTQTSVLERPITKICPLQEGTE